MRTAMPLASLRQPLEGRTRLMASVEKMRRASRVRPALVAFAAASAAALVVMHGRDLSADATPLEWHVVNGTASARGYVSIPLTGQSARLVFGDGSDVTLAPGSRGRVARTTSVGAEVVLEQGRARVHVQHHEHARWLVEAGPFAALLTGTELVVSWSPDAETLDVWLGSGRAEITGPVLGDALSLSAGQHVRARLRDGTVQIDTLGSEPCAIR